MLTALVPTVLRNPVYFLFLLLLAAGAYVTYTLNLWGPMIKMANAASAQALDEFKKRLRDFLESSETGRQAVAMSSGRAEEEIAMQRLGANGKAMGKQGQGVDGDDDGDEGDEI